MRRRASATGSSASASTSPMARARWALIFSAATNISRAMLLPTSRGSLCVPPQPVIKPKAAPRWPNRACEDATRVRQASARSRPPPMQYPEMAAYTGAGNCSIDCMRTCPTLENSRAAGAVSAAISLRSAPTEKNFAFPLMMSGSVLRASLEIAAVKERTHARVSWLVPSWD